MRRRTFFRNTLIAGLGLAAARAHGAERRAGDEAGTAALDPDQIDPYFLDPGNVSATEQESIEEFIGYQEKVMEGRPAIMPRGGKPRRAPTYRFLHWKGQLGDPTGRLVGPLSLEPVLNDPGPYALNAQILGFNVSTEDWSGATGHGTLSIEFRAHWMGEPLTWLYLEQFEAVKGGGTSVGLEYVAQRDGAPVPVVSDTPNLDMRIQLVRQRKAPGVLRKILRVGAFLSGIPFGGGGGGGKTPSFAATEPVVRVPRMLTEGVAFAQATVGGMSEEAPVWGSGFTSFGIARGGSRLMLRPGLWIAVDDSQQIDFGSLKLQDVGGRLGLTQEGEPVNLNYLVLDLQIEGPPSGKGAMPKGVTPKGVVPRGKKDS